MDPTEMWQGLNEMVTIDPVLWLQAPAIAQKTVPYIIRASSSEAETGPSLLLENTWVEEPEMVMVHYLALPGALSRCVGTSHLLCRRTKKS